MSFPLRDIVTAGAIDGSEPDVDAQRLRAVGLLDELLTAALAGQEAIEQQEPRNMNEWSQERLDEWKANAQLIDTINMEFHFASGAHRDQNTPESEHVPTPAQRRFYDEAGSLAPLATAGYPSCAHHLLETLEFFIDVDPLGAFLRIAARSASASDRAVRTTRCAPLVLLSPRTTSPNTEACCNKTQSAAQHSSTSSTSSCVQVGPLRDDSHTTSTRFIASPSSHPSIRIPDVR